MALVGLVTLCQVLYSGRLFFDFSSVEEMTPCLLQLISDRVDRSHSATEKVKSDTLRTDCTGLVWGRGSTEPLTPRAPASLHSEPPGPRRGSGAAAPPVLTAFLRCLDAHLLGRVLPAAQPEGLPIRQIEEHFHPRLRGLQIHLGLLGAPHFSTKSHGIAVLFYI